MAKKKIKFGDLTIKDMKSICENRDSCNDCPIWIACLHCYPMDLDETNLNVEVEVDEKMEQ